MKKELSGQTIYQVFVRNHSEQGNFKSLILDLPRIKALGVDILYLMPIHEIGLKARKGTYGSPYSIKNYHSISADLGTLDDFILLIEEAHKMGLKVMIDIVFHHTSRDATYISAHPKWYIYKNGQLANKVGDWSDIADLEINNPELQEYLIDVLKYWTKLGVDGFRCDVASMIPINFWRKAKEEVLKINKDSIWLAESIDLGFKEYIRSINEIAEDDTTLFEVFDIEYDYDIFPEFKSALEDPHNVKTYIDALNAQRELHGDNLKLHFLENHDQDRIASHLPKKRHLNWIKFVYMIYGVNFIYAGEEYGNKHKPDLFEKDPVDWTHVDKDILKAYQTWIQNKKIMLQEGIIVTKIEHIKDGEVKLILNKPFLGQKEHLIDLG